MRQAGVLKTRRIRLDPVLFVNSEEGLDSLAPVAYKLLDAKAATHATIVNFNPEISFGTDFRLVLLRSKGGVTNIDAVEALGKGYLAKALNWLRQRLLKTGKIGSIAYHEFVGRFMASLKGYVDTAYDVDSLALEDWSNALLLFSFDFSDSKERLAGFAIDNAIPAAILPTGLRDVDMRGMDWRRKENPGIVDDLVLQKGMRLFAPDPGFARRRVNVDDGRFDVLGHPRFSEEWNTVLDGAILTGVLPEAHGKTVVGLVIPEWEDDVWMQGLVNVVQGVATRENVFVVIKPQSRIDLVRRVFPIGRSVTVVDETVHSRAVVRMSDAVLTLDTGAILDAASLGKPVGLLRFCSTFRHVVEKSVPEVCLDSLDEVLDFVDRFAGGGGMTMAEREGLASYRNGIAGGDVLGRYVDSLKQLGLKG